MTDRPGILYNRKLGIIIMCVMIFAACLLGTWKPLHKERNEVEALFWGGEHTEYSINEDLEDKAGYAGNMAVLANKYGVDAGELEELIKQLKEAKTPAQKLQKNQALDASAESLIEILVNTDMSEADKKALSSVKTRLESQNDLVKRGVQKYNEAAEAYNKKIGEFPAAIFRIFVGLSAQEVIV